MWLLCVIRSKRWSDARLLRWPPLNLSSCLSCRQYHALCVLAVPSHGDAAGKVLQGDCWCKVDQGVCVCVCPHCCVKLCICSIPSCARSVPVHSCLLALPSKLYRTYVLPTHPTPTHPHPHPSSSPPPDSHGHHDLGSSGNDHCLWLCTGTHITGVSRCELP